MKISMILDKIDDHQLFIPAFQREYVWKREDAKKLFDSLIKEYPTGTMLTWETANPPELKGTRKYDEKQGAVRILLDGQQRVTTLYMIIRDKIPQYYTREEIVNDTRNLYVNVETLELSYYMKTKMENNPLWCNLTDIFQQKIRAKDIVRTLEDRGEIIPRERDDLIDDHVQTIKNILDRDFPEQTIPVKATVREAIDIFYMVNSSGVSLTDAELALAQISGYWPQARDKFKKKLADLSKQGFVFKLDFIVYALLGCMYHLGSKMEKLHGEENNSTIRDAWKILDEKILDYVFSIMRSNAFIDHTAEVNSVYALIPIIVYCYDHRERHLTDEEIRKIVKWFYYSQIRSRYVSQLPQKLDIDLRTIENSDHPFDELLAAIAEERRLEITPEEFEGRTISHPLFGLMRWYFKSQGAICFTTGVGLRQNMGEKYKLENDHIFPYSRLKKIGYKMGNRIKYALAQELTNRAILTQVANRTKSATLASDYLTEVKANHPKALALQCIPDDQELWELDKYEDFLKTRRSMLAKELNNFLNSFTATTDLEAAVDIEAIIAKGESDVLEFKSSLRWDYRECKYNKSLEMVILKSIAAFANAEGGMLLIGVDDDGNILGLENDYESLKGDRDKFEVHLRNLLNQQFGLAFVKNRLIICFEVINDLDVCKIEISQANEPVILQVLDSNGQKIEKFYIRSGNTSVELPLSQVKSYYAERFK